MTYGYCTNNEEHYGRICECGACYACCTCGRKERRIAALHARFDAAHASLNAICAESIKIAREQGTPVNRDTVLMPAVRVYVSSSRKYGSHIVVSGWGQPTSYCCCSAYGSTQTLAEIADTIADHYVRGREAFCRRCPEKAEEFAQWERSL